MRFFSALMTLPRSGRIAWKSRLRASTAEPPAELPSTRKSSARLGIVELAVGELARQRIAVQRRLAPRQLARLAGGLARVPRGHGLRDDLLRVLRVLLEELGEPRVDGLLDEALHPRVAELGLRLPFELRLAQLHRDDRGEPLADVLALEVVLLLLEQALVARVAVQRGRERCLEAGQVRAALVRVDVVREREHGLDVGRVPLHGDLDGAVVLLALEVDHVLVDGILCAVDVRDEVTDAALGVELVTRLGLPLVDQDDAQALREERGLAEPLHERVARPLDLLEDLGVGEEADRRAGVGRLPDLEHLGGRLAAAELLAIRLAVTVHLGDQPLRESVDHGDTDAVQAARDLVAVTAELAPCVQLRQDDRERRETLLRNDLHGDAGAGIADGHGVVRMEDDVDVIVAPGERLVDGVVDHLVDEVMEAAGAGRADVHARPQPDGLEALQNGDVFCGISGFSH